MPGLPRARAQAGAGVTAVDPVRGDALADDPVAARIRAKLEHAPLALAARLYGERAQAWRAMLAFYGRRGYRPAWVDGDGDAVRPAARRWIGALGALGEDGLDARLYPQDELRRLAATVGAIDPPARYQAATELEVGLTYSLMVAAAQLATGRIQPSERVRVGWYAQPSRMDLAAALERELSAEEGGGTARPEDALGAVAPAAPGYARLRQALGNYREIAARGGWPLVPPGPSLHFGDRGARVAALAARLAASGELAAGAGAVHSGEFDASLASALARFQASHGLAGNGSTLDGPTMAALNVPAAERVRQIELNLERWRWSETPPDGRSILINIPDYRLTVVENGQAVLTMKVIVGKMDQKTPVFSDVMTEVVLNPPWKIPDSIVTAEIVPHLLRDGDYLRRKGYEVRAKEQGEVALAATDLTPDQVDQLGKAGSPFRLVQPPGVDNALGRYKFVLRNPFDIYLHDTPSGRLFARSERDFSHGCIRLENPGALATYLLQDDARWTPELIEAALASGQTVAIPLPHRIPVHISYRTAWVGADGQLELRPDVYGLDAWLAAELAAATPLWNDLTAARAAARTLARRQEVPAPPARPVTGPRGDLLAQNGPPGA